MSAGIEKAGINALEHDHVFLGADHTRNERRIWLVIALTAVMMVAEIAAGTVYGSMALVADGWHMSTHASALLISALAYLFARRQARNPRFTFGTGKLSDDKIISLVREHFDLRPYAITTMLDLLHPMYKATAAYGHFGRPLPEFTWEHASRLDDFRAAVGA
jgi:hypothetical protein